MLSSSPFLNSLTLFLFLLLLFLFAPQILPLGKHQQQSPISLQDELDDLHLYQKAATLASSSSHDISKISYIGTTNPNPKIAILFLTNSDLVFAPLWQRFFQGNDHLFNVYVHVDPSTKLSAPECSIKPNFIPAKRTERGSSTLISAARRLLANAIINDPFNLYFALLSEHCIPLHSFQYIYISLFGNPNTASKAFLNQPSLKSFIEILSDESHLHNRYVARGERAMLPEISFDRFRVGSQFFVLAKRHSLIVLKERKLWRKFKLPCIDLDSCYPELTLFSYIVINGGSKRMQPLHVNQSQLD